MTAKESTRRENQRRRTRRDLLETAARLLREGKTPTVAKVAEEAMVSRATAYRYFPTKESLFTEAPIEGMVPTAETVFEDDSSTDPSERIDKAEACLHEMVYANEAKLRVILASSMDRWSKRIEGDPTPQRQNRRSDLIRAALEPVRHELDPRTFDTLCAAAAVYFGIESMVVFSDVLQMDPAQARRVKSWALDALVQAALRNGAPKPKPGKTISPTTTKRRKK